MESGPIDGGAGLTSGASGSGPSTTSATVFTVGTSAAAGRRRTPGRWRRIPRAIVHKQTTLPEEINLPEEVRKALPPPLPEEIWRAMPEVARKSREDVVRATQARLEDLRRFEETKKTVPSFRAEGYDPSPSTGADQGGHLWTVPSVSIHVMREGSRECREAEEESNRNLLEQARILEEEDEDLCDTEEYKIAFRAFKVKTAAFYSSLATTKPVFVYDPPSDTIEEHLTAEEVERQAGISGWPVCSQAQHFATLALEWYNSTKKMHKFQIAKVMLSKCFTDVDYITYAHVNFTATLTSPTLDSQSSKRLFFAELMLVPNVCKDTEPMRVLSVSTIDDSCFGGCHEMARDIKGPVRKDMDYERCHACSEHIKHPRGGQFVSGHNRTRMPYVTTLPWMYES